MVCHSHDHCRSISSPLQFIHRPLTSQVGETAIKSCILNKPLRGSTSVGVEINSCQHTYETTSHTFFFFHRAVPEFQNEQGFVSRRLYRQPGIHEGRKYFIQSLMKAIMGCGWPGLTTTIPGPVCKFQCPFSRHLICVWRALCIARSSAS